jgi:EAL domain-containing protein (putative c-di-GMP-specific phosphodiesterase class I)
VLDDDPQAVTLICKMLSECGIAVRKFVNAQQFIHDADRSSPDLLILDLALDSTDAVEIIRQLEIIKFNGKVLLASGRDKVTLSEIEQIGRTHALCMLPSLHKPFRMTDLKDRLHESPALPVSKAAGEEEPSEPRPARPRVTLEEALRKNWLEVWYQPKIDLKSLVVCGAEGLIRARHPVHGVIGPAEFLPRAGDPLYKPLSFFVVRRTMTDWAIFAGKGFPLRLSINVPASILNAPGFVDLVRRMTPRDPGFPGMIIEVTEDEFVRNPEWMREVATQLKLYKAWISIDDFGTAYASLARLTDLPFIELKLDRSFVSNCASDRLKYALCQTVVDLAHRFGASLCAEGVETAEDLRCLTKLGFDSAQGYFLAKPMPADRFVASFLPQNERAAADAKSQAAKAAPAAKAAAP